MPLENTSLYGFYEYSVLPQFGIADQPVRWDHSQDVGPDETVHYFSINEQQYALIFEDYDGNGRDPEFVKEHVTIRNPNFKFIEPISETSNSPSYAGFHLPAPSQYCHNITGTFTLVQLAS